MGSGHDLVSVGTPFQHLIIFGKLDHRLGPIALGILSKSPFRVSYLGCTLMVASSSFKWLFHVLKAIDPWDSFTIDGFHSFCLVLDIDVGLTRFTSI